MHITGGFHQGFRSFRGAVCPSGAIRFSFYREQIVKCSEILGEIVKISDMSPSSVEFWKVSRHILEMATDTENQNKVDQKSSYSQDELPDLLPVYYRRLFPYGLYYRWLNYGGGKEKFM